VIVGQSDISDGVLRSIGFRKAARFECIVQQTYRSGSLASRLRGTGLEIERSTLVSFRRRFHNGIAGRQMRARSEVGFGEDTQCNRIAKADG